MRAEEFELSNGLKVVYLQIPKSQNFRLILSVPVGGAHDPKGKEGLSHVLEHTVLCGTESTPEIEFESQILEINGDRWARTGANSTTYDFSASSQYTQNLFILADLLRQVVTEPTLDAKRVEIEKKVIINELYDAKDNLTRNPSIELDTAMHVGKNPYVNVIGTRESISSTGSDDLKKFIKENYDAGHMVLYAAGPMPKQDAADVFEQTLSAIPNLASAPKPRSEICAGLADVRRTRPELYQNYSTLMFAYPAAQSPRENFIEFQASKHLSRLVVDVLRMKHGCFYSPNAGGWNSDKSTSISSLSMSNTPEDSTVACHALVDFYHNIDTILTDNILNGGLTGLQFSLSDPDRLTVDVLDAVHVVHEKYGQMYDLSETIKMVGSVTPDEIRAKAKEMISSLKGIYVQGPEPERVPSLEFMRGAMSTLDTPAVTAPPPTA